MPKNRTGVDCVIIVQGICIGNVVTYHSSYQADTFIIFGSFMADPEPTISDVALIINSPTQAQSLTEGYQDGVSWTESLSITNS